MKKITLLTIFVCSGVFVMSQTTNKQLVNKETTERTVVKKEVGSTNSLKANKTSKLENNKSTGRDNKNANAKGVLQNLLTEPVTTETKEKEITKID